MPNRIVAVVAVAAVAIGAGVLEGAGYLPGARADSIIGFVLGSGLTATIYEARRSGSK